jgi:hypothetical protein
MKKKKPQTNITESHKMVFDLITKGDRRFALVSCSANGEPTCAIAMVEEMANGMMSIAPFFVAVTPGMKLADHQGDAPQAA